VGRLASLLHRVQSQQAAIPERFDMTRSVSETSMADLGVLTDPAAWILGLAFGPPVLGSAICALYLVKSAMGIDIMPGPSPLHDLLYAFVR
jgi:hypothetical protein